MSNKFSQKKLFDSAKKSTTDAIKLTQQFKKQRKEMVI